MQSAAAAFILSVVTIAASIVWCIFHVDGGSCAAAVMRPLYAEGFWRHALVSASFFAMYNLASFAVLARVSSVMHSLAGVGKRAVVVLLTARAMTPALGAALTALVTGLLIQSSLAEHHHNKGSHE